MSEAGNRRAQRFENLDLGACVGDMILAPDDVGDRHIDVVHHRWQGVEEQPVLTDQHRVRHGGGVDPGVAARQVFP